ncbi:MAG: CPBP family intramembrane glutamic endopeptidase [Acidobacteriaceae bacterium]
MSTFERLRALGWVVISVLYFLLAERLAASAATGLASGAWEELWYRVFLLFLLIVGYAALGYTSEGQKHPVRAMGLVRREGWKGELALGAAMGWGGMVACVLPIALSGGLYLYFYWSWSHVGMLFLDIAILAVAAVAEEVAFRGYPFQRLIDATGPVTATVLAALGFGILHMGNPDASAASTLTTVLAGWLLALAYLRTRALWVPIGFHFAWNAAMGVLFGLPISGLTEFSPVIKTYAYGPLWLTGGGYGPEGGAVAIVVLLALLVVMMMATRSLKYRWAIPEIVPGGIPVDIDAISRRQHEAAMGPQAPAAPAAPVLVQIGGIPSTVTPATMPPAEGAGNTWAPVRGERDEAVAEKPVESGPAEPRAAEHGANEKPVEGQVLPETHEP